MFALHVQPGARGSQDLDIRGRLQDLGHQAHAVEQVLKVIHNEQQAFLAKVIEQLLSGLAPVVEGEA